MTNGWKEPSGSIPTESIRWDSSWPRLAGKDERDLILAYLWERFGIPKIAFDEYLIYGKKKSWWLLTGSECLLKASTFKTSVVGLRSFQRVGAFIKPTTRFIQVFGPLAKKAMFELGQETLQKLLRGGRFVYPDDLDNGYIILFFEGHALGLGLLIDGMLRSQLPQKGLEFLMPSPKNTSASK